MSVVRYIQDQYHKLKIRPLDISDQQLLTEELEELRNSELDLIWSEAANYIGSTEDVDFQLEAVDWISPDHPPIKQLSVHIDERIVTKMVLRGIKFSFSKFSDNDIFKIIEVVKKHQIANLPLKTWSDLDDNLTSYCELIDQPMVGYSSGNQGDITEMSQRLANEIRRDGVINIHLFYLSTNDLYQLILNPGNASNCTHQLFIELINRDSKGEYLSDPSLKKFWRNLDYIDRLKINNRKVFHYLHEIGRKCRDINQVIKRGLKRSTGDTIHECYLREAYLKTDLATSFGYLDYMIELTSHPRSIAIGIIIRLLKRGLINLRSYEGTNKIIDHLLQFQPRRNIKNARSAVA